MNTSPAPHRSYQAEVYLALATIVQAITLTALGSEVVTAIKTLQPPEILWVFATGLLSLYISISFWYIFMRDYFFGFRVLILTPQNHLALAAAIFIMGFLQFIAFHFLAQPRLWLTLVLLTILVMFINSWYMSSSVRLVDREDIRQAVNYDPGAKQFYYLYLALGAGLLAWYLVPAVDGPVFRVAMLVLTAAALVLLNWSAQKVFQRHLEIEL
jgi:protein-S-isoprenylcysteine O-methyltransferase Ste14